MRFDPTQFIMNNQELFITVGTVVFIGTMTLCMATVALFIVLRTDQ